MENKITQIDIKKVSDEVFETAKKKIEKVLYDANLDIQEAYKKGYNAGYNAAMQNSKKNNKKDVIHHYTANDDDSDEGNGNYFANNATEISAHYFVDGDSITQSAEDNIESKSRV